MEKRKMELKNMETAKAEDKKEGLPSQYPKPESTSNPKVNKAETIQIEDRAEDTNEEETRGKIN